MYIQTAKVSEKSENFTSQLSEISKVHCSGDTVADTSVSNESVTMIWYMEQNVNVGMPCGKLYICGCC